jgi:cyclopropane fatty-acyl-phospholipid synthase-like methyltransferase
MTDYAMKAIVYKTSKLIKSILPKKDFVEVSGSVIPAKHGRCCGTGFRDNEYYLDSAEKDAKRLVEQFGCNRKTRIMDVGCGQGRLPIGILRVIGELNYLGIDVNQACVDWCTRHIGTAHPSFKFRRLNVYNERCNKEGVKLDQNFRFDVEPGSIDIVWLYSVFSHTTEEDMRTYLWAFQNVLSKNGKVFFTTFVEKDVPNFSVNPDGYVFEKCSGPLHIVRYNEAYLLSLLGELGYSIQNYTHATDADGQSALYLAKK